MTRRWLMGLGLAAIALPLTTLGVAWLRFPSDRTPEGAYLRIVTAVNRADPALAFAYIETAAQHACYTIRDRRRDAYHVIDKQFPEPERSRLLERYRAQAEARDGADIFAEYAKKRGWMDRLRRDLSGVDHVEVRQERAVVVTMRKTRYPFRRRENGIWGLTLYTPLLVAEAERASRDAGLVIQAATDYEHGRAGRPSKGPDRPVSGNQGQASGGHE